MPAELPVRVQPVAGAQIADYPWATAAGALSAIDDTVSTLNTQLDQRATMVPTLSDWEGRYRDDFDGALDDVLATAGGLKDTITRLASSIVSGAEDANHAQRIYNSEAIRRQQQPQTQPSPP